MTITKEQALGLYQTASNPPPEQTMHKVSNLALLHRLSSHPLGMIAETFMRPKMAMKYHLLPALAHELACARPTRGKACELSKAISLARSVALLLETADPAWCELPKSWVFFGSNLDNLGDYTDSVDEKEDLDKVDDENIFYRYLRYMSAGKECEEKEDDHDDKWDDIEEELENIFAEIHVEHPMRFLENFCAPLPDMAEWRRFFWLNDQEMNDFLAEKAKSIEMINADDEEVRCKDETGQSATSPAAGGTSRVRLLGAIHGV